jgi:ATP-dependent DNA ligase
MQTYLVAVAMPLNNQLSIRARIRYARLRKLIGKRNGSRLLYLDHLLGSGSRLYTKPCDLDLEGIVAKWKSGHYVASDRRCSWVKIKNPAYSQLEGREQLFERQA